MNVESTITCPKCGGTKKETIPTDSCQNQYTCSVCGAQLEPKDGKCCVFCSYGDTKCPAKQEVAH